MVVPHDPGAGREPVTISVTRTAVGSLGSWDPVEGAEGYGVVRGGLDAVTISTGAIDLGAAVCLVSGTTAESTTGSEDEAVPSVGRSCFYLAGFRGAPGPITFGTVATGLPRVAGPGVCL